MNKKMFNSSDLLRAGGFYLFREDAKSYFDFCKLFQTSCIRIVLGPYVYGIETGFHVLACSNNMHNGGLVVEDLKAAPPPLLVSNIGLRHLPATGTREMSHPGRHCRVMTGVNGSAGSEIGGQSWAEANEAIMKKTATNIFIGLDVYDRAASLLSGVVRYDLENRFGGCCFEMLLNLADQKHRQ